MSADGAMVTSAMSAWASSLRVCSEGTGLDAGLVDRAGGDVCRAEVERRQDRSRRADPSGCADADRRGVTAFGLDLVAQRSMVGTRQTSGRLSVWPPESASTVISSAIGTSSAAAPAAP